eukprot:gene2788-2970_t
MTFLTSSKPLFADNYEIICPIGQGGYSTVYKARSKTNPNQIVAVKRLDKRRKNHTVEEMTERCKHEAKILSEADHPNIVDYITCYDESDYFYIITEYLPGSDIFTQIRKEGKGFTELECRRIIKSLLITIKSLHDQNIIHRDLKLENLFYYPKADGSHSQDNAIKLIDFGFATYVKGMNITDGVGTLYYAAPEVYKHEPYGKPVDLWSIGVIAYILMYGKYPFYSKQKNQLSKLILSGKFEFPEINKSGEKVSTKFKTFIMKLLLLNPLKRFTVDDALEHNWINGLTFRSAATVFVAIFRLKKLMQRRKTAKNNLNNLKEYDLSTMKSSQLSERFASSTILSVDEVVVEEVVVEDYSSLPQPSLANELIAMKKLSYQTPTRGYQTSFVDKVAHGIEKFIKGFFR